MYLLFFVFVVRPTPQKSQTKPRKAPRFGLQGGFGAQPTTFFEPHPFPGLPGPVVGPGRPKIDRKIRGRIYRFIFPKVCSAIAPYLRLLNKSSGPGIGDVGGSKRPLLPQNPLEKVGGEAPILFQWVLEVGGAAKIQKVEAFLPGSYIEQPKIMFRAPGGAPERSPTPRYVNN